VGDMEGTDEVAGLEAEFPQWRITARWSAAASGPEGRQLVARRDGVTVTAWDAAGLRRNIREAGPC
jgi:hypothetical protein